jgi:hypothetical protein
VSIFDLFDKEFTLLCLRRSEQDAADLQMAAARHRIPLTVLPIDSAQARDLYETDFALIRPDQHVAWRGNKLPDNCDGLLTTTCGWHYRLIRRTRDRATRVHLRSSTWGQFCV